VEYRLIGCIMYADDLVLLSASFSVLQQMFNILCEQEMTYLDVTRINNVCKLE